jgi:DsbC/DsbD-like thiol-disulfide interchange protein
MALTVLAYSGSSTTADDASSFVSPWSGDARSAMRLIAGSAPLGSETSRRAGLEIQLSPGWHTYWRYPGDAGVPPRFDFGHSTNVAAVKVLWPAPQRISEHGLIAIGYLKHVILPLIVTPKRPNREITLRLTLDYAICEKLCVPVQGVAELELSGGASEWDGALAAAEALIPKRRALRQGGPIAIQSVRRDPSRSQILVDVAAPAGAQLDLFAEGPDAQWALPLPKPIEIRANGLQRFAFELEGAPPGATYKDAVITLTVAGEHPIEVSTPLD